MGASKAAIRFSRGDSQHCFRALLLCSAPPALLATSREEQDGSSPGTPRRPRGQRGGARREGRASFLCSFSVVLSRGGRVERGKRPRESQREKQKGKAIFARWSSSSSSSTADDDTDDADPTTSSASFSLEAQSLPLPVDPAYLLTQACTALGHGYGKRRRREAALLNRVSRGNEAIEREIALFASLLSLSGFSPLANGDEADEREARLLSLSCSEEREGKKKQARASFLKSESLKRRRVRSERKGRPEKAVFGSLAHSHFFLRASNFRRIHFFFTSPLFCRTFPLFPPWTSPFAETRDRDSSLLPNDSSR